MIKNKRNRLLIVWFSGEKGVAQKLILLYGSVMLLRSCWDEATIMVWGPSTKLLAYDIELQEQLKIVQSTGVKFNAYVVCSDDYDISYKLKTLGIELIHTGEILTNALQSDDVKVITF